jgi:arsenite oxidase small subunit
MTGRCERMMIDAGRRKFLTGASATAVGAPASAVTLPQAKAVQRGAGVSYPLSRLGNVRDLKLNEPFSVSYPDNDALGVLIKLGVRVPGGAGPDGDIVGFSTICPHRGTSLAYNRYDRTFNCPGHYSRFDVEAGGLQIWGHATQNLPQYFLRIDPNGDVYAEGIDELLYGRMSNVL